MKLALLLLLLCFENCLCLSQSASNSPEYTLQEKAAQPQYDLHIRLESVGHLFVSGTVRLSGSKDVQSSIDFVLADTMRHFIARVVEPQQYTGDIIVGSARGDGGRAKYTAQLPRAVPAGQTIKLQFSYDGGERPAFVFSLGQNASFADGVNTAWYPEFGASGNGTGILHFSVPAGQTVVAVGTEDRVSPATFHVDFPAHFTFAVAGYSTLHVPGTVPITGYVLRRRPDTQQRLERLSRVLDHLVQEFGPYPYHGFSIVEVPDEQAAGFAGASSAGLILVTSSVLDNPFSLAYYAHELSHQWWGNLVATVDGAQGEEMLSEGLAQYGSLTTVEALEGMQAAETYRRTGAAYYDSDQSALGYLKLAAAGLDQPLDTMTSGIIPHSLADSKGFLVLDMLARSVGREQFHRALQSLTREHAFGTLTWQQFLDAVQRNATQNMDWFFQEWFSRTGAPDLQVEWRQEHGRIAAVLKQPPPYYRLNVGVLIEGDSGQKETRSVHVDGASTAIELPVDFPVRGVTLDPDFFVLHWTPQFRAEADGLAGITKANFNRIQGNKDQAGKDFENALASVSAPDTWAVEFRSEVGLARLAMSARDWPGAKAHFLKALSAPTRPANELPWAYYRLANVAQQLKDDSLLNWAVNGAVTSDSILANPTGAAVGVRAFLTKK
jgi:hypothetical protein